MAKKIQLTPRKSPVQARAHATVEVILEATVQVLVSQGLEKLTSARVAERAGLSVGTLYQYYPNKQALLSAVVVRHLDNVITDVETACFAQRNQSLASMAEAVTLAFVAAKLQKPDVSRALYALPSDDNTNSIVASATRRGQLAVSQMLASCTDARFDNLDLPASIFSGALIGPVQMMLTDAMPVASMAAFTQHLVQLSIGYLRQVSTPIE